MPEILEIKSLINSKNFEALNHLVKSNQLTECLIRENISYLKENCKSNIDVFKFLCQSQWDDTAIHWINLCIIDDSVLQDRFKIAYIKTSIQYGALEVLKYLVIHKHINYWNNPLFNENLYPIPLPPSIFFLNAPKPWSLAIEFGHIHILNWLIEYSRLDVDDDALLIHAIQQGQLDIVKHLYWNYRADIHIKDIRHETALVHGIKINRIDIIDFLIENGANLEARNDFQHTPLVQAIENNNEHIVRYLLEQDINPNTLNIFNKTGIHSLFFHGKLSANKHDFKIIRSLLQHGIDFAPVKFEILKLFLNLKESLDLVSLLSAFDNFHLSSEELSTRNQEIQFLWDKAFQYQDYCVLEALFAADLPIPIPITNMMISIALLKQASGNNNYVEFLMKVYNHSKESLEMLMSAQNDSALTKVS